MIISDLTIAQSHKYEFMNQIARVREELKSLWVSKEIADSSIDFFHVYWRKRNGYNNKNVFFK